MVLGVAVWAKWYDATITSPGAAKTSMGADLSVGGCRQNCSIMRCMSSAEEEEAEEDDDEEEAANRAANSRSISR